MLWKEKQVLESQKIKENRLFQRLYISFIMISSHGFEFITLIAKIYEQLAGIATTEMRIIASATLILLAITIWAIVTPLLVHQVESWLHDYMDHRVWQWVSRIDEALPWTVPARLFIRALQLLVGVVTGIALLVVWGRFDLAIQLLLFFKQAIPFFTRVLLTIGLALGAYVGADMLEEMVAEVGAHTSGISAHQEVIVFRILQLSMFGTAGLIALSVWQVNLTGLLAGAGFLGIIFGLAARETLGALIAGFVLMFSRPFEIGDWVIIGDEEGIVTQISIVNTRLRNFDGEYLAIPNDRVTDRTVTNRTREGKLRLRADVGVDYQSDPEYAAEIAQDALNSVEVVANNPQPQVLPTKFGDSAIILELRFWISQPTPQQKWRATRDVIYTVKQAFDREGIKIPFPQREFSGRESADERDLVNPEK